MTTIPAIDGGEERAPGRAARIIELHRAPGDVAERLNARIPLCRGNSPGSQAREMGLTHCAECCFGTGIEASSAEELAMAIDLMDAVAEIERLRHLTTTEEATA